MSRARAILVTPTGVDLDLFQGRRDATELRRRLGLDDRLIVGWVGSFRPFHALDIAVEGVAQVRDSALLLVGDGPERACIEQLARTRNVDVVTTGTVPHADLPRYLDAMDVGLVVAADSETYHYSPLKLAEYLAAGLPVVAPNVSQFCDRLVDGTEVLFVPPGDPSALADALARLRDDPDLRTRSSCAARAAAPQWSWDRQVERIVEALARSHHGADDWQPDR